MLAPTHSAFGIFLTLILLAFFGIKFSLHWTVLIFAALGSIIPDIDHPGSIIGRIFYPISTYLERKFGHRTITHSLIGWLIFSVLFFFIIVISFPLLYLYNYCCGIPQSGTFVIFNLSFDIYLFRWSSAFSIGYFSHLILDMFNKRGSQLFWPDKSRDVIPKDQKYRSNSGARSEIFIFLFLLFLVFLALPISKYGISSTVRWLLGTPGSAIQEFKQSKIHCYAEFKGIFKDTRQSVEDKAEILDVDNKRLVVLYKGEVYTLSDELASDINASNVRVAYTKELVKVSNYEFKDKDIGYLYTKIPAGSLVSGTIQLPKDMEVKIPASPGSYKVAKQKGDELQLSFAGKAQIKALAITEAYELSRRKSRADLAKLQVEADKLKTEIAEAQSSDNLTPLGKELLMTKEKAVEQQQKLAELKSRLEDVTIRIEEAELKIKASKPVFSGIVYIRM